MALVAKSVSWPSDLKHSETFTESSAYSHSPTKSLSQCHVESCVKTVADKDADGNIERSAVIPINDRGQNRGKSC